MRITKIKINLILLLIIGSTFLAAQPAVENKYQLLTDELLTKNSMLDSLNILLENRAELINLEKSKENPNVTKISELFSSSANLTNSIDLLRNQISDLSIIIQQTKDELYNYYTNKIDSLKPQNNNQANIERIKFIEKRLLVSPKINILSFSPQKVLNLKSTNDSLSQQVFTEYLSEAYDEVELKISEVTELKKEINNIIELNEETKDFLEDIDFDNNFAVYSNPNINERSLDYSSGFGEELISTNEKAELNTVNSQSKYFTDLLFQFGLVENYNPTDLLNSNGNSAVKNLKEFNTLIETVEKQLKDYKTIIANKLKGS